MSTSLSNFIRHSLNVCKRVIKKDKCTNSCNSPKVSEIPSFVRKLSNNVTPFDKVTNEFKMVLGISVAVKMIYILTFITIRNEKL